MSHLYAGDGDAQQRSQICNEHFLDVKKGIKGNSQRLANQYSVLSAHFHRLAATPQLCA